jgi:spore coat polysaccharide biosynthesis protein SpsF
MSRVIVVQARMTSSRLPGKILMDVAGSPMLERQIGRLRRCRNGDQIVVATTTNGTDDPVVDLTKRIGVPVFRGDEDDVLGRYLGAARMVDAHVVVRVTGDCPLVDPGVIDLVVDALQQTDEACDYASNVNRRTYPRGLDAEAFFRDTLERVGRLANSHPSREHVTYFINSERPDLFVRRDVRDAQDNSDLRWTVDTLDDLTTIRRIFDELGLADRFVPYHQLVALVRERPWLASSNLHIQQKDP